MSSRLFLSDFYIETYMYLDTSVILSFVLNIILRVNNFITQIFLRSFCVWLNDRHVKMRQENSVQNWSFLKSGAIATTYFDIGST